MDVLSPWKAYNTFTQTIYIDNVCQFPPSGNKINGTELEGKGPMLSLSLGEIILNFFYLGFYDLIRS